MANYDFLDAHSSVKTAASSTIGDVDRPIVVIPDTVFVDVIGSVASVAPANQSVSGTVGVSVIGLPTVTVVPTTPSSIIEGIAVLTSTSVTTLIADGGAAVQNYITDIWLANTCGADQ